MSEEESGKVEGSYVLYRGRDQFDLFAEALGSALPRITDGSAENSAEETSEGNTEYQEVSEGSGTTILGESGDSGSDGETVPNPEKKESANLGMAGVMRITMFVGKGDGREDPVDFIADVEMAARSWDSLYGADTDHPESSKIALFRQNLDRDGDAWHWWTCIVESGVKESWEAIKKAFLARYEVTKNKAVHRFNIQNELMLLQQRAGQSIAEYVFEAERLSERVPKDMDNLLAMVFIRGLADQETRRRVSYDLRDTPEVTFSKALHMVKSWYQEIGVPDPFNPHSVGFNGYRNANTTPVYAARTNGIATVNATAGTVGNSSNGVPGGMTQETFNQMMLNFMNTRTDFQQSPHRTPGVTNAASGVAMGGVAVSRERKPGGSGAVCFNCGERGHISTVCRNPPLSYADQRRVRDEARAERESRAMAAPNTSGNEYRTMPTILERSNRAQPASTGRVNMVSSDAEASGRITEVTTEEEQQGTRGGENVSCVKLVSVPADKEIVGRACATLMRMPAVAAIFRNAMADKRVRIDEEGEPSGRGPPKVQRTRPPSARIGAGGASRPPQVVADTSESESSEDEAMTPIEPRIIVREPQEPVADSQTQRAEPVPSRSGSSVPAAKNKVATKAGKPVPPINWMKGQKQYSLQDALNEVTPRISFPQLLDVSPRLRRELAELLRSSVPRARKKGKGRVEEPVEILVARDTPMVLTRAHEDDEVACLYISAWIGNQQIEDVLVDGGAMLDLMSQGVAERLRLEKHVVRGLGMRLADDSLVRLDYYVWADVVVAGVVARIKAYIVPVSVTYKVLLSRRWLKRVKGIEHHENNVLYIEGVDEIRRKVKGKPAVKSETEVVKMSPESGGVTEMESEEAEDAIEILLHELDHWEDGEGEEELAGNC